MILGNWIKSKTTYRLLLQSVYNIKKVENSRINSRNVSNWCWQKHPLSISQILQCGSMQQSCINYQHFLLPQDIQIGLWDSQAGLCGFWAVLCSYQISPAASKSEMCIPNKKSMKPSAEIAITLTRKSFLQTRSPYYIHSSFETITLRGYKNWLLGVEVIKNIIPLRFLN